MAMDSIDINCDIGEGYGNYIMQNDEKLMEWISSANIACGFHAGDPAVIQRTVQLAKLKGVAIGAHPGLPDLQGFGRREMKINPSEAYQLTLYQIGAIYGFVKAANAHLHHVKAHGALYNMAARDAELAAAVVQAVYDFDPLLKIYALAGSGMETAAKRTGLSFVAEVFADRSFDDDGKLTPRSHPHAVITDPVKAIEQLRSIVLHGEVVSVTGKRIPLAADTVCVHGDHLHSLQFAEMINKEIKAAGIAVQAPHHL